MKTTIAIIATTLLLGACANDGGMMRLGGCPRLAAGDVPSGCQVPGYGAYYMTHGGSIVQIANVKSTRELLRLSRDAVDSPGK